MLLETKGLTPSSAAAAASFLQILNAAADPKLGANRIREACLRLSETKGAGVDDQFIYHRVEHLVGRATGTGFPTVSDVAESTTGFFEVLAVNDLLTSVIELNSQVGGLSKDQWNSLCKLASDLKDPAGDYTLDGAIRSLPIYISINSKHGQSATTDFASLCEALAKAGNSELPSDYNSINHRSHKFDIMSSLAMQKYLLVEQPPTLQDLNAWSRLADTTLAGWHRKIGVRYSSEPEKATAFGKTGGDDKLASAKSDFCAELCRRLEAGDAITPIILKLLA